MNSMHEALAERDSLQDEVFRMTEKDGLVLKTGDHCYQLEYGRHFLACIMPALAYIENRLLPQLRRF